MSYPPDYAIIFAWLAWVVTWWLAAVWSKRAIRRPPQVQEFIHMTPTVIGAVVMFSTHASLDDPSLQVMNSPRALFEPIQLWRTPPDLGWACFGLAILGFAFCWWARVHLGKLWSGSITLKADHRIVDTGPYRLVRHPIYTGLILAALGTALEKATLLAFGGVVLITFGFWIKARFEEGFLRAELGREAYDAYARRTRMLVPFLL
ncbi:MAG TPA: isoprenylcysteine carboxylmethyltransferase family protein [Caulobacteraceae bacterium]|jgi:protein-S-isoprenylcysteine O-methyltransferase Ste14|nr:isoprenylcysteine carboxylmethyltransferase family protein [Caulobacteraceae bacterium]